MSDSAPPNCAAGQETIAVTLDLDAKAYQSFLQKAQKAGVELGPYLSSTLNIVLGCRVFNETIACSPKLAQSVLAKAPCESVKQVDAV